MRTRTGQTKGVTAGHAKAKPEPTREELQDDALQKIGANAFEAIAEMVAGLDATDEDGEPDDNAREVAQQKISEDPLSIQVRSGWYSPGEPDQVPEEFEILLGTGGPAVRIVGDLDMHGEPMRARLETQDWGTPWTEYRGAWGDGGDVLLTYARQFVYVS